MRRKQGNVQGNKGRPLFGCGRFLVISEFRRFYHDVLNVTSFDRRPSTRYQMFILSVLELVCFTSAGRPPSVARWWRSTHPPTTREPYLLVKPINSPRKLLMYPIGYAVWRMVLECRLCISHLTLPSPPLLQLPSDCNSDLSLVSPDVAGCAH